MDLGTTGLKVGAVSLAGELLAEAYAPLNTTHIGHNGAEQDPREWWNEIRAGARSVLSANRQAVGDMIGIGITGQWGSTVPVAADGEPAGPCLMWSDTRGADLVAKAVGGPVVIVGVSPVNLIRWLQITGGVPAPTGPGPLGHELYLRHREPEVYERTEKLLEPVDYIGMCFTGRAAATRASMFYAWLTDNRPGAPLGYVPELVRRAGRDPDRLPELVPVGTTLGKVQPEVSRELGIPSVPVVAGIADTHAAFVGSGAVKPYEAHITISSTCWLCCEVPFKGTDLFHQMATAPGLRANRYLLLNNQDTAGRCLAWLRETLMPSMDYEDLTALASTAPPGSNGVMFAPWLVGEHTPMDDPHVRGSFLNLSIGTGRAHLVRAVLEGVAFNARWLLETVEKFIRRPIPSLRIQGGGAQSDLWCQVYADILDRRIERIADPRFHSLKGAALFAAISLGKLSLDEVPQLVGVTKVFEPIPQHRRVYESMYVEFKRFYSAMHGIYARLNSRRG